MTTKNKIRAKLVIWQVALRANKTPAEVRRDMEEAINEAWRSADPAVIATQIRNFPSGKPSVEEFLLKLANRL